MKKKTVHYSVISAFTVLYAITSLISTVHVVDFFALTNPQWLAISLAIAFEVGAAASLASIISLKKMNKLIVWSLFIVLTAMQAMGNTYYAYVHAANFQNWIELFGLVDEDIIYQKRILSLLSGGILPVVALGYIKALVDYIKPEDNQLPVNEISAQYVETTTEPERIEPVTTKQEEPIITTTSLEPRLNNTKEAANQQHPTIDAIIARGGQPPGVDLKKPHDK